MKIVFFDGYCNLCNAFVDQVIRWDTRGQLKFASLQGATAASTLAVKSSEQTDPSTVIYFRDGQIFERSTAVLRLLADLGGAWKFMLIFLVIPSGLRDIVYKLVAKYRYQMFGKKSTCRVPTDAEKGQLLP